MADIDVCMLCIHCGESTTTRPCVACGDEPWLEGRYELLALLGHGAHGSTFRARVVGEGAAPAGSVVAIKELPLGRNTDGKRIELFEREAAVLGQLSHPRIPRLWESFIAGAGRGRALYIVQGFVEGEDLSAELARRRTSEDEVLDLLEALCDVLAYLHERSPPVVHRDLKPGNLLRDRDGAVHLVDFGAVRDTLRDSLGGGSTVAGTFGYMAPEQMLGEATPRSDLYALGAVAVHLLTRRPPQALLDRAGVMQWRVHARVSPGLGRLLDQLLAVDPAERPTSARVVATAIQGIRAGEDAPAPSDSAAALPVLHAPAPLALVDADVDTQVRRALSGGSALARTAMGAPATVRLEGHLPGLVDRAAAERIAVLIEDHLGVPGSIRPLGSGWRWRAHSQGRAVVVDLATHGDHTVVKLGDNLGGVAGGLFGGLVGGIGGGVGGGLGWVFFMISVPIGALFVGSVLLISWMLAAVLYRSLAKRRARALARLLLTLEQDTPRLLGDD